MSGATIDGAGEQAVFSKISRRIIPLLFCCYLVAFLDRVNVGFAKLQMASELQMSDAVYGFGAGIFFLGYFLFEVPSNLALERVGARLWIARIMFTWAIVSGAFAFVGEIPWGPLPAMFGLSRSSFSFYALRFLLGVSEAGFFPGIILYLTYWFPNARRAKAVALFMTAVAAANVIGAPLSGAIMQFADGRFGWSGWRWLFVLEAIPSMCAAFVVLRIMQDGPNSATWLTAHERAVVRRALDRDITTTDAQHHAEAGARARAALTNARVWALAFVYLSSNLALYGVNFWMPTLVQEIGIAKTDFLKIGLVSMIPWGTAGIVMVAVGAHSDKTNERRWHAATSLLVVALGMLMLAVVGHAAVLSVVALTIVTSGVLSFYAAFWAIPTAFLRASAAAAGIAWINSIGNLGGQFGPDLIGRIRSSTGSGDVAFLVIAGLVTVGACIVLLVTREAPTAMIANDIMRKPV